MSNSESGMTPIETTDKLTDKVIGYFKSIGKTNGSEVYEGPRGGLYYYTAGNKKIYLSTNEREQINFN